MLPPGTVGFPLSVLVVEIAVGLPVGDVLNYESSEMVLLVTLMSIRLMFFGDGVSSFFSSQIGDLSIELWIEKELEVFFPLFPVWST